MSVQLLRAMLSSRNDDEIPFPNGEQPTLTEIRTDLKKAIEGDMGFKLVLHTDEPVGGGWRLDWMVRS